MAGVDDAAHTRLVRGQNARRYVDTSMLDTRVSHGIVHLTGVIRAHSGRRGLLDGRRKSERLKTPLRGYPTRRSI